MKLLRIPALLLAAAFALAGSSADPANMPDDLPRRPKPASFLHPLASPATNDTDTSSLFRGPDGTVYLTWAGPGAHEGERALQLSTLVPGDRDWSVPRLVVSTPQLMENWADFATLAVGTDRSLWVQWYQTRGVDAHGYEGWFARSTDGGATWTPPASLGHEFVALAPLSGGRLLAVWLESTRARGQPAAPGTPAMRLRSRLLAPDGATLAEWTVDPDVCTCCQNSVTCLPGDRVLVAYRGHTPEEIRDNRVAFFDGHAWDTPHTLHDDGWKIAACPVNGPAADSLGEKVAIGWFTMADGSARVQAKLSTDGGKSFGPALPIDLGRPLGRLDLVMLADGSAVISWLETKSDTAAAGLYVRRIFPDGKLSAPRLLADTSSVRASGFARMAAREGTDLPVVISWTEAVPADPANPKSPASTRIHTAEFAASALDPDLTAGANRPRRAARERAIAPAREFCEVATN